LKDVKNEVKRQIVLPEIRKPGTMNDKPQFSSTKRPEQKKKV
jgi:hypothetical protein